jgi:hypothetical protein
MGTASKTTASTSGAFRCSSEPQLPLQQHLPPQQPPLEHPLPPQQLQQHPPPLPPQQAAQDGEQIPVPLQQPQHFWSSVSVPSFAARLEPPQQQQVQSSGFG